MLLCEPTPSLLTSLRLDIFPHHLQTPSSSSTSSYLLPSSSKTIATASTSSPLFSDCQYPAVTVLCPLCSHLSENWVFVTRAHYRLFGHLSTIYYCKMPRIRAFFRRLRHRLSPSRRRFVRLQSSTSANSHRQPSQEFSPEASSETVTVFEESPAVPTGAEQVKESTRFEYESELSDQRSDEEEFQFSLWESEPQDSSIHAPNILQDRSEDSSVETSDDDDDDQNQQSRPRLTLSVSTSYFT